MTFNPSKCKNMYIGKNNSKHDYTLFGKSWTKVQREKDLGLIISNYLKGTASQKARSFEFKSTTAISHLSRSLVRPCLVYTVSDWSHSLIQDIDRLEGTYENPLKHLNLFSLKRKIAETEGVLDTGLQDFKSNWYSQNWKYVHNEC